MRRETREETGCELADLAHVATYEVDNYRGATPPEDPPRRGSARGPEDPPRRGSARGPEDPPRRGSARGHEDPPRRGSARGPEDPPRTLLHLYRGTAIGEAHAEYGSAIRWSAPDARGYHVALRRELADAGLRRENIDQLGDAFSGTNVTMRRV